MFYHHNVHIFRRRTVPYRVQNEDITHRLTQVFHIISHSRCSCHLMHTHTHIYTHATRHLVLMHSVRTWDLSSTHKQPLSISFLYILKYRMETESSIKHWELRLVWFNLITLRARGFSPPIYSTLGERRAGLHVHNITGLCSHGRKWQGTRPITDRSCIKFDVTTYRIASDLWRQPPWFSILQTHAHFVVFHIYLLLLSSLLIFTPSSSCSFSHPTCLMPRKGFKGCPILKQAMSMCRKAPSSSSVAAAIKPGCFILVSSGTRTEHED